MPTVQSLPEAKNKASGHVAWTESTCFCHAPMVGLAVETAGNMAGLIFSHTGYQLVVACERHSLGDMLKPWRAKRHWESEPAKISGIFHFWLTRVKWNTIGQKVAKAKKLSIYYAWLGAIRSHGVSTAHSLNKKYIIHISSQRKSWLQPKCV